VVTYAALLGVTAAAWALTLRSPMAADDMAGTGMVMTPTAHDALTYLGAWAVMMAAMMLPGAVPMIGLYAATQRQTQRGVRPTLAVAMFVLTYLALWAATGVPLYFATLALMAVSPAALTYVTAAVLVAAGLFQLSPLKHVCLRHCRSPLGFLLGHWRPGWHGALALGWMHACYCLGCCWALMLVLALAGAMGLPWVLLIACLVAAEKLLPAGARVARVAGVALLVLGLAVVAQPSLVALVRGAGTGL
jgi:predicted metal-binding membrane protein